MALYDYVCSKCEHTFEVAHGMTEKPFITCEKCYAPCYKLISYNVNKSEDKLWEFTDINSTGKPIEIRSKGQWQKHLKRHGLHDDIPQRPITEKDFKLNKENEYDKQKKRDFISSAIREEMKQKNIYDANKLFRKR